MKSSLVLLVTLTAVLAACSPVPPSAPPSAVATLALASPVGSCCPSVSSTPSGLDPETFRCPPQPFDATASLGPEFEQDIFVRDESKAIATEFVAGLATIYADPTADVCQFFTEQGWTTALASDPRLRAVAEGRSLISETHLLRIAFENDYDLRVRPPRVPLDIIFDIPAGAETRDLASGQVQTSTDVARVGMHADLVFDGHRWRVDGLGPINADYLADTALPSTPPPGPACAAFARDRDGAPFDTRATRAWCDAGGSGRTISREQLVMFTRYPCGSGHVAILQVGRPLGSSLDRLVRWEYVRDPADSFFKQHWLTGRYDGDATMPDDAVDTGWTNGNIDLWISPSDLDHAVYIVRGKTLERWPRAADQWGVIDCN